MRSERRDARRTAILEAAYAVLRAKGYRGATMSAVAEAASASKETLYSWFGDKQGLFRGLIEANAAQAQAALTAALAAAPDAVEASLVQFGEALLTLLTGERAVAINRIAAAEADRGAAFGMLLAASGRDSVMPRLAGLMADLELAGVVRLDDPADAADAYLGLLLGDLPVRRIIGVAPPPRKAAIAARAERAARLWLRLYAVTRP